MESQKNNFKTIDEYIKTYPKDFQKILKSVKQAIKEVVPEADEVISYQIPAFKLNGYYVVYIAGWKNHISLYPAPKGNVAFKKELSAYKGGKGTVQFPLDKPMPLSLIRKIVKYRVKENFEKIKAMKK